MGTSWDPGQSSVWSDPLLDFANVIVARDLDELTLIMLVAEFLLLVVAEF
jgi:hypothetical protein